MCSVRVKGTVCLEVMSGRLECHSHRMKGTTANDKRVTTVTALRHNDGETKTTKDELRVCSTHYLFSSLKADEFLHFT